jgi:glycosyltransferase involved in cell wall biosynthesis
MPPALQCAHVAAALGMPEPGEADLLPRKHYFYYPANLWPHKNHRRVLDAFRAFTRNTLAPYAFVLTGDPTGWPELAADYADLDLRHLGHVSTRTVTYLYRRATALVFLSLFEGFGAPLLEAFHAGTPVLCSDTTSLPEVAAGAALLADPTDLPAMTAGLQRIAGDAALRRELIARGKQRLAAYSWQRSAESFIQACIDVAARARSASALAG